MDLTRLKLTPDKNLHSREHVLAEDLSQGLGERKRFAAYLGIAKRYHESDLRGLLRYVLEKNDLPPEARGKYFFAALRGLSKKGDYKPKLKKKKIRRKKKILPKKKKKTATASLSDKIKTAT